MPTTMIPLPDRAPLQVEAIGREGDLSAHGIYAGEHDISEHVTQAVWDAAAEHLNKLNEEHHAARQPREPWLRRVGRELCAPGT